MSTQTEQNKKTVIRRPGFSFFDWLGSLGTEDIGIDLGTSNVVVYVKKNVWFIRNLLLWQSVSGPVKCLLTGLVRKLWRDARRRAFALYTRFGTVPLLIMERQPIC